jgi:putative endonuclease
MSIRSSHLFFSLNFVHYTKIYIGYSADPNRRLQSHNHPQNKGWTKRYQPWEIIYTETFESRCLALKREKQLKTAQGRKFIHEKLLKHS